MSRNPTTAQLARLVAPQLRADDPKWVPEEPEVVAALLRRADVHGVTALLPPRGAFAGAISQARRDSLVRFARAVSDLALVREACEAASTAWAVVKGPVVAFELYPRPDIRPFADVDVLVSPERFEAVLRELQSLGGRCLVRNWELMRSAELAEVSMVLPAGSHLDLHWSLVNTGERRSGLGFRTTDLLSGSRPTGLLDGATTTDDVSTLVHLAWHCTHNGATRLLWLCDVELAATRVEHRAHEVVEAASRTGTSLAVAVSLDRAAALFPSGGAARMASTLPDGAWRRANRSIGRYLVHSAPGRRSGQALARATRGGSVASVAALGRRLGPTVRTESLVTPRGGDRARQEYLSWVEAFGR